MTSAEILKKAKNEYIFKNSNFMENLILFKKSMFAYYKKMYNKNLLLDPKKIVHYLNLKFSAELRECNHYINEYLNNNQGWYQWFYFPENFENEPSIQIVSTVGKHIENAKICGMGFFIEDDPYTSYGWQCWVSGWKFNDNDKSNKVISLKELENK